MGRLGRCTQQELPDGQRIANKTMVRQVGAVLGQAGALRESAGALLHAAATGLTPALSGRPNYEATCPHVRLLVTGIPPAFQPSVYATPLPWPAMPPAHAPRSCPSPAALTLSCPPSLPRQQCTPGTFTCTPADLCEEEGETAVRAWVTPFASFDHVGRSLLTLFIVATLDGYMDVLQAVSGTGGTAGGWRVLPYLLSRSV